MNCPHCGSENDNFQTVCTTCGEPLTHGFISCPVCGKIVREKDEICPRCHSKMYEVEKNVNKKNQVVTHRFVARAPLSFTFNILLTLAVASFLVLYVIIFQGSGLLLAFNVIGLGIAFATSVSSLLIRLFINNTSDSNKLEKRISLLKTMSSVAYISNIYVFLFVILPRYLAYSGNHFLFNIYLGIYIGVLFFTTIFLFFILTKSKVRTR